MDKPWEDYKALNLYGTASWWKYAKASWWKYAKKTSFYKEIIKKYPMKNEPKKQKKKKKILKTIKKK